MIGFYNIDDRVKFWGKNGAFWGGLWSLLFSGIFLTVPGIGPVMVLGHLAGMVFLAIEGAVVVGGLSAFGAALFSLGIPKDSPIQYEEARNREAHWRIPDCSIRAVVLRRSRSVDILRSRPT